MVLPHSALPPLPPTPRSFSTAARRAVAVLAAAVTVASVGSALVDDQAVRPRPPRAATLSAHVAAQVETTGDVVYVAHRAAAMEARENSLSAVRATLEAGVAEMIDVDTRLLGDGTVVVHHDPTADRATDGTGRLDRMTLERWRSLRLDLGDWLDAPPPPERPATLAEVLREVDGRLPMSIEVKDPAALDRIVRLVRRLGLADDVQLNTNRPSLAGRIHRAGLRSHLWRSAEQMRDDDPQSFAGSVDVLDVDITASDRLIERFVDAGVAPVWAHTVTTRGERDRALGLGVVGIVTDDPRYLVGIDAAYPLVPTAPDLLAGARTQVSDPLVVEARIRTLVGSRIPDAVASVGGHGLTSAPTPVGSGADTVLGVRTTGARAGRRDATLAVSAGSAGERRWTAGSDTEPVHLVAEDLQVVPRLRVRDSAIRLRVRLRDSAARAYAGPRRETGAAATPHLLSRARLVLVVRRGDAVVDRLRVSGADTGESGDGVGTVRAAWTGLRPGAYTVTVRQTGRDYTGSRQRVRADVG